MSEQLFYFEGEMLTIHAINAKKAEQVEVKTEKSVAKKAVKKESAFSKTIKKLSKKK